MAEVAFVVWSGSLTLQGMNSAAKSQIIINCNFNSYPGLIHYNVSKRAIGVPKARHCLCSFCHLKPDKMDCISSIKTRSVILILASMPIFCCHEPRVKDDNIYSDIEIIGKETCHQNPDMNAWIINLESPDENSKVGIEMLIDEVVYKNVVKTEYDLSEVFSDTLRKYNIRCSPKAVLGDPCNVSEENITPTGAESIPTIEVLSVGFSGTPIN